MCEVVVYDRLDDVIVDENDSDEEVAVDNELNDVIVVDGLDGIIVDNMLYEVVVADGLDGILVDNSRLDYAILDVN